MKFRISFFSLLFFTLFLFSSISFAQGRNYSVETSAGELTVESTAGELGCFIKLGNKVISNDDTCDFSPQVLKHIKQPVSPFTEVIVFQDRMLGNACDGTSIYFLGFRENGEYELSDLIEYCGGPEPIITVASGKITVTLPVHKANRGNNRIPREVWIYKDGKLSRQSQRKRRVKGN